MELRTTSTIIDRALYRFREGLEADVIIAGAGPSGMVAARQLARKNLRVVIFERNLYTGGGLWGGGMFLPCAIVEKEASSILTECGVRLKEAEEEFLSFDPVEAACKLTASAIDAGARIFVGIAVEDLIVKDGRVQGVVVNWTAIERAGMHVDPLGIPAKVVVDATGHDANLVRILKHKLRKDWDIGEGPMWAEAAERDIINRTGEFFPGLFVTGMAVASAYRLPRMGPIFGGMLLSGVRVADQIASHLSRR